MENKEEEDYDDDMVVTEVEEGRGEVGGVSTRRPKRVKESTVSYFRQISSAFDEEDVERMQLLVASAIEEMRGYEASMASHKMCSTVVEQLISFATIEQVFQIATSFSEFYLHLLTNRYGSHVMEMLLYRFSVILATGKSDEIGEATSLVLNICDELASRWVYLVGDTCGCHCLRALISLLSGREPQKKDSQLKRKRKRKKKKRKNRGGFTDSNTITARASTENMALDDPTFVVPDAFGNVVSDMMRCVLEACRDADCALEFWQNASSSATLQLLLLTADGSEKASSSVLSTFVEVLLRLGGDDDNDDDNERPAAVAVVRMATHPSGSALLEVLMTVATVAQRKSLTARVFVPHIRELARDDYGNFAVQRMLSLLDRVEDVVTMRRALKSHVADLLRDGRAGVVWRLVEACGRCESEEARVGVCALVSKSVGGAKDWLTTLIFKNGGAVISAMECRVAHALLDLPIEECRPAVRSIVDLDVDTLERLATHPWGSRHVIEPILDGPSSFEWARQKMIKTLLAAKSSDDHRKTGTLFARLATNRFGAFSAQKCFLVAQPSDRRRIVKQLVAVQRKISGDRMGQKVLETCRATLFVDSPKEWMESQTKQWERRVRHMEKKRKNVDVVAGASASASAMEEAGATTAKKRAKKKSTVEAEGSSASAASSASIIDDLFRSSGINMEKTAKRKKKKKKKKKEKEKEKKKKKEGKNKAAADASLDFILGAIRGSGAGAN